MSSILSIRLCDKCKERLHRNPEISGDWEAGGQLLSFCPICGTGYPAIDGHIEPISNRKLKILSSRFASKHSLSYKEVDKLVSTLKGFNRLYALHMFKVRVYDMYHIEVQDSFLRSL